MSGSKETLSMNPKKFALWLFIATVIMMFGGFTSAFIVMASEKAIQDIALPNSLLFSTIIILTSSATIQMAFRFAKKDEFFRLKTFLIITLSLGFMFLISQYMAWKELVADNIYFSSNYVAGSFIYIFTGIHGLHIVSALVFLMVVVGSALRLNIHSKKLNQLEMCITYWHFLGALWLYLYIFLLINF